MTAPEMRSNLHAWVRSYLAQDPHRCISTASLTERLPADLTANLGQHPGSLLINMAKRELADCATQGDLEPGPYGREIRRWNWHAPKLERAAAIASLSEQRPRLPKVDLSAELASIRQKIETMEQKLDTLLTRQ